MPSYRVGYIFKPTHDEIHYVKRGASGDFRRKYSANFTRDIADANISKDKEKLKSLIVKLAKKFPADDEYTFTPVLVNVDEGKFQRYINKQWYDEAIEVEPK